MSFIIKLDFTFDKSFVRLHTGTKQKKFYYNIKTGIHRNVIQSLPLTHFISNQVLILKSVKDIRGPNYTCFRVFRHWGNMKKLGLNTPIQVQEQI